MSTVEDREFQRQQEVETQMAVAEGGAAAVEKIFELDPWPGFLVATLATLLCIFVLPVIFPPAAFITWILSIVFGIMAIVDFFRGIYQFFVWLIS